MELQFLLSPLIFITTLFLVSFMIAVNKGSKCKSPPPSTPPGPPKLPVVGSIHHLLFSLPQRRLRDLAGRHGPVMLLRLGQVDLVVISSRTAAEDVTKTQDLNFASRPELAAPRALSYGCTNIAFAPYGNYWRQLKKVCVAELLNNKRVKSFASIRGEEIGNLLKDICLSGGGEPINLSVKLRGLFNTLVARAAFGSRCRQQRRFIEATKEGLRHITGFSVADLFPSLGFVDVLSGMRFRLQRVHREFDKILDEIIKEHQEKMTKKKKGLEEEEEDLVDALLKVQQQSDLEILLTINNLKAVILDIFVGGTESSAVVVEWAMAELMKHPELMTRAQDEVRQVVGQARRDH